jgi:hypothetical protein
LNFGVDFGSFTPVYGGRLEISDNEIVPYFTSAKAMMLWSTFCALQSRLIMLGKKLLQHVKTQVLAQTWPKFRLRFTKQANFLRPMDWFAICPREP